MNWSLKLNISEKKKKYLFFFSGLILSVGLGLIWKNRKDK